jgi:hypothetical protein
VHIDRLARTVKEYLFEQGSRGAEGTTMTIITPPVTTNHEEDTDEIRRTDLLSGAVQSGSPERPEEQRLAEQHVHDEKERPAVERHRPEENDRLGTERRKDKEKGPLGWIWLIRSLLQTSKGRGMLAACVGVAIVAVVFIVMLSQRQAKPYPSPPLGQGVTIRFVGDPVGGESEAGRWSRTSAENGPRRLATKSNTSSELWTLQQHSSSFKSIGR